MAGDKIGRKTALLLCTPLLISSWITIALANSIYLFYLARVLSGIGDGCLFAMLPTYVGEIATPKVRGTWGNLMMISLFFGQMLVNIAGGFLDIKTTAYVMVITPILFFATFIFMPESPYYYLKHNRKEEARKSLQRLRRKSDVEDELKELEMNVLRQESEPGNFLDLFKNSVNRKAFFISVFLRFAQKFSGLFAFSIYCQYLFEQTGSRISPTVSAIIFTGSLAFMVALTSYLMDKFGRRKCTIISSMGCAILLASESLFFFFKDYKRADVTSLTWLPLVGLVLYIVTFSLGLGLVPTLMQSELFSTSIKAKSMPGTTIAQNVFVSLSSKICQELITNFGLMVMFLFFSVCCLVSAVVAYFVLPETKGKTLEEVQQMLKCKRLR